MRRWFYGFILCIYGAAMLVLFLFGLECIYKVLTSPTIEESGWIVLGLLTFILSNGMFYELGNALN